MQEKKWKFSSSEFLGGRKGLQQLHTEFNNNVACIYELERGDLNSRATHKDLNAYKEALKQAEYRYKKEYTDLCNKNESRIDALYREANTRFYHDKKSLPNLPEVNSGETAEQYRHRIGPGVLTTINRCKNLVVENTRLNNILKTKFNFSLNGKRYSFSTGLAKAFKDICYHLGRLSGINMANFGGIESPQQQIEPDYNIDTLTDYKARNSEYEY